MRHYVDRLHEAVRAKGNPILVGLDPRYEQLPAELREPGPADRAGRARAIETFIDGVLETVAPLVPAVKFQAAFYESLGPEGLAALGRLMAKARVLGLIVIFDGKRNDIGSTAEAYAEAYLGGGEPAWQADAVTINPYLGSDGVAPFAEVAAREGRGVYVLVRTSNPSAREFQDLVADGRPIYRHVAERVRGWGEGCRNDRGESAIGAVVGATYPAELAELRAALPDAPFLVPGYGAQGGGAADVAPAFDERGLGALVNNSRGILFAFAAPRARERFGGDWRRAVAQAVVDMQGELSAHGLLPA